MPRKARPAHSTGSSMKYRQQSLFDHFSSSPPPARRESSKPVKGKARKSRVEIQIKSATTPSMRRKVSSIGSNEESDSSDAGRIKFETQSSSLQNGAGGNSDSEDVSQAGPSAQNRLAKRRRIVDSDAEESGDEGISGSRGRGRQCSKQQLPESDSEVPEKRRRRLVKGTRSSSDEEVDDVLDGIDEEKIIDNRLRGQSMKKSRFMKNLERLKMKKRGQLVSESEQEASEDDLPIPDSRPGWKEDDSSASEGEGNVNNDDSGEANDFIIDDGDDAPITYLPAAFSMNTHQELVHHFKIVCQYFVHLAVTSADARSRMADRLTSDEYFSVPLASVQRKLADVRDSIASSVWRPAYRKALRTYPEFNLTSLDYAIPQCDACHLGGRMSKFVGRLCGTPYDQRTFQALDPGSSSDSDKGNTATPPEYNLGRFCAQRTKVFHELCHWEHELFRELSREVEELSDPARGFAKIAFAGGAAPPDDVSDADQVMEWLDQRGIVNAEWLKVKHLMSRATNLEADAKRGKEDDF